MIRHVLDFSSQDKIFHNMIYMFDLIVLLLCISSALYMNEYVCSFLENDNFKVRFD
jgi:hypothetical protein